MKLRWPLVLCLASCTAPVEESTQEIIGGSDSDASQNSVVRLILRSDLGIYTCSGTLIAPNLVLTARHCVSATADGNVGCNVAGVGDAGGVVGADYEPSALSVSVGATRMRFGRDMGMVDAGVRVHGMKIYHDDGTNLCNHDLSLLLLDAQIMNAPISPIRLSGPPTEGETFTAVGWGITDTTPNPMTRQQRPDIPIEAVGPSTKFGLPPNEFAIGEGPCEGDSGGPALDSQTLAIIGVVSRGGNGQFPDPNNPAANCIGGQNVYTQVFPFKDLILRAFSDAGAMPWLEGMAKPNAGGFGSSCAVNSDCQSLLCRGAGNDMAGSCTSDCTSAPCMSGFDCREDPSLATKVCVPHVASGSGCSMNRGATSDRALGLFLMLLAFVGWRRLSLDRRRS
jgi:hypothetical protein